MGPDNEPNGSQINPAGTEGAAMALDAGEADGFLTAPDGRRYWPARRDGFQRQAGSHSRCAKPGCAVRPSWRVILGHHVVQVYVCQRHLAWGAGLDMTTESRARELGWETGGYPTGTPNYRIVRETRVIPEMGAIRRVDYGREISVSASFPQYEIITDGDGFTYEMSVWS